MYTILPQHKNCWHFKLNLYIPWVPRPKLYTIGNRELQLTARRCKCLSCLYMLLHDCLWCSCYFWKTACYFKGTVSRDIVFFSKGWTFLISTFCKCAESSWFFFSVFLLNYFKSKYFLTTVKTLILKTASVPCFRMRKAFHYPPVTLNIISVSRLWWRYFFWFWSGLLKAALHILKWIFSVSRHRYSEAAYGKIKELVRVFTVVRKYFDLK